MSAARMPSVTTVLGAISVDGLPWAAANETATFAIEHRDEWVDLPSTDAYDRLRKHHRGVWDHRAALGTLIHSVNEAWATGEEADLTDLVTEARVKSHVWTRMDAERVLDEASLMVDGLEAAWAALRPVTVSAEDVVRYPHPELGYIGQADWRATIDGVTYLIDVKTTGKTEPTEALYWDKWRLQLAAYRGCTEIVRYDTEGRVHRPYAAGIKETGTEPLPPVDATAILLVRANGDWQFHPVSAGDGEHETFLRLREVYGWLHGDARKAGAAPFKTEVAA